MIELKTKRGASLLGTLLDGQARLPVGGDPEVRGKAVIPLYLRISGKHRGRLTLCREGSMLLSPETASRIPSGSYLTSSPP